MAVRDGDGVLHDPRRPEVTGADAGHLDAAGRRDRSLQHVDARPEAFRPRPEQQRLVHTIEDQEAGAPVALHYRFEATVRLCRVKRGDGRAFSTFQSGRSSGQAFPDQLAQTDGELLVSAECDLEIGLHLRLPPPGTITECWCRLYA
jgi:hypothetical protein